jgi:hypothetical protein
LRRCGVGEGREVEEEEEVEGVGSEEAGSGRGSIGELKEEERADLRGK